MNKTNSKLLTFCVLFSLLSSPLIYSSELKPTENMNPTQSKPSLKNIPKPAKLKMEEKNTVQNNNKSQKNKPSWWSWLINNTNKPANFHYIDIIELLS
ncbi:MAG: hypothetical protein DRQ47_02440 [Gammaproteobacteria bacterium]|nr:MAG: hypothetical protein DRQ47_02440 [Gammaproteobacteria bacterium]